MKRPDLFRGTYESGDRVLEYWTKCPHCPRLSECKKKRMPLCDEDSVGWLYFHFTDGSGGVRESGVIELKKIDAWVKRYLECEEEELPEDIALPPVQLELPLDKLSQV